MMRRVLSPEDKKKQIDQDFGWINRISWLMDNQFNIGGFRFGLDPILNFIPLGGAIAGFGTSLVLVIAMWRNGASPRLVIRMLLNICLDALLGSIPFFGNIFDFFSKANERNIKTAPRTLLRRSTQRIGCGYYSEYTTCFIDFYRPHLLPDLAFLLLGIFAPQWHFHLRSQPLPQTAASLPFWYNIKQFSIF